MKKIIINLFMDNNILTAFLLTFLAGASTAIGGLISCFIKKENISALAVGLGFSAGVMIYVSLVEIIRQAQITLTPILGDKPAAWATLIMFFVGIGLAALVDRFIPDHIGPEMFDRENISTETIKKQKLHRIGLFTAVALAIHNFPEGLATFMAGLSNLKLGITIAIAIAIHNIPEGISVVLPIYQATGSRMKGFLYSALSGIAEPIGAICGYFFFKFLLNDLSFGVLFAAVAGIMVYISFDELLPTAREYGNGHLEILGVTLGMFVMAVSLILF